MVMGYMIIPFLHAIMMEHQHLFSPPRSLFPSSRTRWASKVAAFQAPQKPPKNPKKMMDFLWIFNYIYTVDSPWWRFFWIFNDFQLDFPWFHDYTVDFPWLSELEKNMLTCSTNSFHAPNLSLAPEANCDLWRSSGTQPANWPIFCRDRTDIDASTKSNKVRPYCWRTHRSWSCVERIIQFLWFEILTKILMFRVGKQW